MGAGQLFIVAAPSGGGKTSLVQHLVSSLDNIQVSISHTTRDQRVGELEGSHYFFVSEHEFLKMASRGEFLEYATVYGHHYGTSFAQISERLLQGIDVLLDIDWQGASQIRQRYPEAISIFIVPPSLAILRERLMTRQRDSAQVIEERMQKARAEIGHYDEFDYLIINDEFAKAADALRAIVIAERSKLSVQKKRYHALISFLCTEE